MADDGSSIVKIASLFLFDLCLVFGVLSPLCSSRLMSCEGISDGSKKVSSKGGRSISEHVQFEWLDCSSAVDSLVIVLVSSFTVLTGEAPILQ